MITQEEIRKLSTKYQASPVAVAREYCQHNILANLYTQQFSQKLLFKGGTALRIIYGSPRFSEDLDFTGVENITYFEIEDILTNAMERLEQWGLNFKLEEAKKTTGGYLAKTNFSLYSYKFLIKIEISFRQARQKIKREISSVKNDYIHTYDIIHLPLPEMINGKISALLTRAKARDWYDLYFFLRSRMLDNEQKKFLPEILEKLKHTRTDFKKELKEFLPRSHQLILRDFKHNLEEQIKKFL